MKLPGVGRKTANVLQAVWFGKPTLAVDTHVYRVSHRLGLVPADANTPRKVEDYLMRNIPLDEVSSAHHWILPARPIYLQEPASDVRKMPV